MSSEDVSSERASDAIGPGESLRAAREKKGLSQREAADLLNLPCRFVTAMEEDAFDRLPAAIFARGYLRAYARLVNLDANEVLARYAQVAPPEPVDVVQRPPRRPLIDPSWLLFAAAMLVVATGGGIGWLLFGGESDSPGQTGGEMEAVVEAPATPPGDGVERPGALSEVEFGDGQRLSGGPAIDATDVEPMPGEADVESPNLAAASQPVETRSAGIERHGEVIDVDVGSGNDVLEIGYREDCWTEIHDLDGGVIFQDLVRGNRRLRVRGSAPFRILLGYAGGASVSLNGQSVALAPHTRDGVANLVVGQ